MGQKKQGLDITCKYLYDIFDKKIGKIITRKIFQSRVRERSYGRSNNGCRIQMNKVLVLVNITGLIIGISYGLHGPILPIFAKNIMWKFFHVIFLSIPISPNE